MFNHDTLGGYASSVSGDVFREHKPDRREEIESAMFPKSTDKS